jgi:tetratricopeptide (TPR) repeat protein
MDAQTTQALVAQLCWIKILLAVLSVLLLVVTVIMVVDYWRRWYGGNCGGTAESRKFYTKASRLMEEGSYAEAHALATKRMSEKPDDSAGYWFAGMALYRQDKPAEALPLFRKVIDIDPGSGERLEPYLKRCEAEAKEQAPSE